ncbi:AI-2E family transporter [Novosphingobium sp.]|uniref:AI-2E family transporter n=1 Tax=Novosphingobium sp. TaxID=1874826 RepID=UPI00333EE1A4
MPQPDPSPRSGSTQNLGEFAQRVLVVVVIGAVAIALWRLADLVLLFFGVVLFAIGLRAGATFIAARTRVGVSVALVVVVIALIAAFAGAMWFFGSVAARQMNDVALQAPAGLKVLIGRLQEHPYGRYALEQLRGAGATNGAGWAASLLSTIGQGLALGAGYAVVTFFASIYLAAQPELYRRMGLKLLPPSCRDRANRVFDQTRLILRSWLAGQFVVMLVIGILSGIGLWLLGIEAAFALGLVGGLLAFIPYAGPILAAIPAVLVALTQGPSQAGMVILMYFGVHFIEGNFVTPLVQAEVTALPPVLALLATIGVTMLFGPAAVLLAAPLTLFAMVVVRVLWVEQVVAPGPRMTRDFAKHP